MTRIITTVAFLTITATTALAGTSGGSGSDTGWCGVLGGGSGSCSSSPSGGTPAPGPIAGAGIGYLIIAGGFYAVRRWRKRS